MQLRGVECKIQPDVVNARIKNVTKNFAIALSVMLSEVKHLWLISGDRPTK